MTSGPPPSANRISKLDFPVVGLGASAGGLAAVTTCLKLLPAAPDMAFVVILHLSPDHDSSAAEILQRSTSMKVSQVRGTTPIERNQVYVVPPTNSLLMYDGHLSLGSNRKDNGRPISVDEFFRTLAEAHGDRAIAVVLSGTGSDGSVGLGRIKERGGVVIAQSPDDAEFDGMPESAIATGQVDAVLPVADIPQRLVELRQDSQQIELPEMAEHGSALQTDEISAAETDVEEILKLVQSGTGHNFMHYKRGTVLRRIARRMQVVRARTLPDYLSRLKSSPAEIQALLGDMLIGVTNFFRDREEFDALDQGVIPRLFMSSSLAGEPLRAWVAGCSTGEEAYSLAILLTGARSRAKHTREIQVFASDIDERGLAIARAGIYGEAITVDVSPESLRQHFDRLNPGYRVNEALRRHVVFAAQNVLRDPPFSRVDLITCRNVLIYLNRQAQAHVLKLFHFGLRPGGFLFLGNSETVDAVPGLFEVVDAKHRIYQAALTPKTDSFPLPSLELNPSSHPRPRRVSFDMAMAPPPLDPSLASDDRPRRVADRAAAKELLAAVLPELRSELRAALLELAKAPPPAVNVDRPEASAVNDDSDQAQDPQRPESQPSTAIERYSALVEDLKSSNEELQAMNEEMRSAGEELETSKEELQSTNEELSTVNAELKLKVEETARINDVLQNLMRSTEIATVFINRQMCIQRFTPSARTLFNLIETDVGRSLFDITHRLDYNDLLADAEATFLNLRTVEREVRSRDGRWLLARFLPYRTGEDVIDGAVLTFVDITSRVQAEGRVLLGEERMQLLAESIPEFAMLTTDASGLITSWSKGAEGLFGYSQREILGQPLSILFTPEDRLTGQPELEIALAKENGKAPDERWLLRKDGSRFYANGVLARLSAGGATGFAKIIHDTTERHRQQDERDGALAAAHAAAKHKDEFLAVISHELKHPLNLIHVNAQLLLALPEGESVPAIRKAGQTIERSVTAQARIIDDLLDSARFKSGKLSVKLVPVDLGQVLEPTFSWARAQCAAKGLQVDIEAVSEPLSIRGDLVRIEQIVVNLVGNAIKFTPPGGKVRIRLHKEESEAVLDVADDGRGITPEFLPHVFGMFEQEEGGAARREGGLGIGLGIALELAARHGGRIEARSPGVDQGSTFTLRLPLHESVGFIRPVASREEDVPLQGLKILLVDDDIDGLETFGWLLRSAGADVTTASSGSEALHRCEASAFDLLISDLGMPNMDGYELVRRLRLQPESARMPAVALSGYGRDQDVQEALAAGFTAHLTKPAELEKLIETALSLTAQTTDQRRQ